MRLVYGRRTLTDIVSTLRTDLTEVAAKCVELFENTMDDIKQHEVG